MTAAQNQILFLIVETIVFGSLLGAGKEVDKLGTRYSIIVFIHQTNEKPTSIEYHFQKLTERKAGPAQKNGVMRLVRAAADAARAERPSVRSRRRLGAAEWAAPY